MKGVKKIILSFGVITGVVALGLYGILEWKAVPPQRNDNIAIRIFPDDSNNRESKRLKLSIPGKYITHDLFASLDGPPVAAINYKTLAAGNVLPIKNPDIVLATVVISPPKFVGDDDRFMAAPFGVNFESFKDSGQSRFGLSFRKYRVVDVESYPFSELYLKDQNFHDFYMYCGLHAVPAQDFCRIGKVLTGMKSQQSDTSIDLIIRFDKRRKSEWKLIERNISDFYQDKIEVIG